MLPSLHAMEQAAAALLGGGSPPKGALAPPLGTASPPKPSPPMDGAAAALLGKAPGRPLPRTPVAPRAPAHVDTPSLAPRPWRAR